MAHFLRVYGIAHGDFVPGERVGGRLGVYLPADLYDDYAFFESKRDRSHDNGFSYRGVFAENIARREGRIANDLSAPVTAERLDLLHRRREPYGLPLFSLSVWRRPRGARVFRRA